MASTIQLQRTINLAQQYQRLAPLTFTANTANDPAFSNADWVMQTILSPALGGWRWNRVGATPSTPTFTTDIGVSDYIVNLPTFGWIEKAVAYLPGDGFAAFELQVELIKGEEPLPNQPARISAQYDDDSGNITFRVFPAPDKIYNVVVDYQKSAPLFTALNQTWNPIPDYLSYLYNEGFQAKAFEYSNDPRFTTSMQIFMTDLATESQGLSQSQKNVWLADKLNSLRQLAAIQGGRG
jgi:hypothetical protein